MHNRGRKIKQVLQLNNLTKVIKECPLCTGQVFSDFAQVKYENGNLNYLICKSCGLVFQSPHMNENSRSQFYEDNYRTFVFGKAEPPKIDLDIQKARAKHISNLLKPYSKFITDKNHLDIGCGLGLLIDEIHKSFNTQSTGIEPDNVYRSYASSQQDIRVYPNLEDWVENVGARVDLVTLSHVLEHVDDPVLFLSNIRSKILFEKGLLLIEVPNLLFHPSLELAHIFAFSPQTIREVLVKSGYEILFTKNHGVPLRSSPRFITIIAQARGLKENSIHRVSSNPNCVEMKRSLGMAYIRLEDLVLRVSRKVKNRINHTLQ